MTDCCSFSDEAPKSQALPKFPVTYTHSRSASALYLVDEETARQRLAHTGIHAVTVGGRGIANVSWFDYADSSIGPYRELSIGLLVSPHQTRLQMATRALLGKLLDFGSYLVALPVTSELAKEAGVLRLGLPKTLMQLALTWSEGVLDATALEANRRVLSMRTPLGFGPRVNIPKLTLYSELDRNLLLTRIETDFRAKIDFVGRPRISLEDEAHPLSREVATLGLTRARCLGIVHGAIRAATLFAPDVIPRD